MYKNCFAGPAQPFAMGVTVMVAKAKVSALFTVINAGVLPVPDAASPIEVLLLIQV